MDKKHIYIIHGYQASPQSHWFPWLEKELSQRGAGVSTLKMPIPEAPKLEDWLKTLEHCVGVPDENDYFVAHSLGCITLLQYLNTLRMKRTIGNLILVAGFMEPVPGLPELDHFSEPAINFSAIKEMAPRRRVIASNNDCIVPPILSRHLAKELETPLISINNGGHFLGEEGFINFPEVLHALIAI